MGVTRATSPDGWRRKRSFGEAPAEAAEEGDRPAALPGEWGESGPDRLPGGMGDSLPVPGREAELGAVLLVECMARTGPPAAWIGVRAPWLLRFSPTFSGGGGPPPAQEISFGL